MVLGFGKWAAKKFLKEGPKAIRSVPANVGSLKETKKFKESLEKVIDKADLTRPQKTEVLMEGHGTKKYKTKMPGMVKSFGDVQKKLERLKRR